MNIPNRITVSGICLIPIFLILMRIRFWLWGNVNLGSVTLQVEHFIGAYIYISSTTDWIDSHYASKYNLVTNFREIFTSN